MKLDRSRLRCLAVVCLLVVQLQDGGGFVSAQRSPKTPKPKATKAPKPPKPTKPTPAKLPILKCGAKTDLVFMLDSSTSVSDAGFNNVREFVIGMLRQADINSGNVRVGLMTYQTWPFVHFDLIRYRTMAALERAIRAVPYTPGSTNAAQALRMMRERMFIAAAGDRPLAPNVAMLITDGVSNLDSEQTIPEAVASHEQGIHIFVVGIGMTDTLELEQMATPPGRDNLFLIRSFDELTQAQIRTKTFKKMCDMIILNGHTTITTARPTPTPMKEGCPKMADIAFLLDASSSLSEDDFQQSLLFITDLIFQFPIDGGNKVRVSVTSFASAAITHFRLYQYLTVSDVIQQVAILTQLRGGRNLVEGIRAVQTHVFVPGFGDREEALNVVVIITRSRLEGNVQAVAQAFEQLEDAHVIVVAVGEDDGRDFWGLVTPPRSSNLFMARSFEDMTGLKNQIMAQICEVCDSYIPGVRPIRPTIAITTSTTTARPTTTLTTRRTTTTAKTIATAKTITTAKTIATAKAITTAKTAVTRFVPTTTTGPRTTTPKYDCRVSGDLVWLVDSSGSVGHYNFYRTLDFIVNLTSHLDIAANKYRVALVTFSDSDNTEFDLTNRTRDEVLQRIQSSRYLYGSTNIYSALRRARTQILNRTGHGNRPDVPDLCILITDGHSNVYPERTIPEARLLKRQGVALAGIGIKLPNHRELEEMVSDPKSKFAMTLDDFDDLESLQPDLVQLLCHSSDQCRRNPCMNGAQCSSVFDEYFCSCVPGFTGRECQKSCQTKSDVVFVLDSSGSVGEVNFQQMKDFLKKFLYEVDVESCNFRIGVLKFGSSAFVQFHLNSYSTTEDLTAAVDNIRYSHGFTYTADAVRVARDSMFQPARGDRPDARNVLVFLTEGLANVQPRQTLEEVRKARNAGIHLVPIGIGSNNREEMKAMATHERGMFFVDRFSQLENITTTLADYILEDVDQCQPNPCQNGGVCEDRIHDFVCKCASGFSGKVCARACSSHSDIAFLVDTTSYMGRENFAKVKDFVKNLVDRLALWNGESRVGLVTFSGTPMIRRYLNEPASKVDILGAINALQYDGGYPSTNQALDLLSYELFTDTNGDRPEAHNYAVLITAGQLYSEFELPRHKQPRHAGIHVFGIGIALQEGDKSRMNEIVSDPQASAFTADDPERLNEIAEKIAKVICEDPDQCSRSPCQNRGTCTDAVNSFTCKCIAGYAGTECEKECPSRADVVFLVDSSGSIGRRNFARSLDFLSSLVAELNIDADYTRVAMITFSSKAKIAFYLDSHRNLESLRRAIYSAQFVYGESNIADAFRLARESIFTLRHGDRPDVRNLIVLLTDGLGNVSPARTIPEAEKCREAGVHVLCVGIGMENAAELEDIVSEPRQDNVLIVPDFGNLNTVLAKVFEAVCDDGDSCDINQCQNNGTCVDGIRTFKCLCADGYSGKICEKGYTNLIDLAFVVDTSVSVGRRNFNKVLDFIASFARALPIYSRKARIAVVTYSNTATVRIYLSSFVTRHDLLRRIENLEYDRGGMTNTAEALRVLREDVFDPYRGDRPDAANIAVLITDGVSNVQSHQTLPEAEKAHAAGIHVYAIGVAMNATKEVEGIASQANTFFVLRGYDELEKIADSLLDRFSELKPKATARPTFPPTIPRITSTTTTPTPRPTTTLVITQPPTTLTTTIPRLRPGEACYKRLDLVFAFDTSGGLPKPQFTRTLDFSKRLVNLLNVGVHETRVGAISFSSHIRTAFHLIDTTTIQDVHRRLSRVLYRTGKRDLKQGMNAIRDTMFLDQNGNRPGIRDVAIIITDGFTGADGTTFVEESRSVAERGIELFQIVWNQRGREVIQSDDRLFAISSPDALFSIVDDVKQAICDVGS